MTDHPGSAVLPKAAAASRRHTIIHWVVSLPVLAETALGIQWDLQRGEYVRELLDKKLSCSPWNFGGGPELIRRRHPPWRV
ncbi:MAG TPA: hypothetical protein VFN05_14225 [Actinomycetes bacterium]|nr:hypothetical protein [Actinomycetes bacterium]